MSPGLSTFVSSCSTDGAMKDVLPATAEPLVRAVMDKVGIDLHWRYTVRTSVTERIRNFVQERPDA
jgi:hypothetical protein